MRQGDPLSPDKLQGFESINWQGSESFSLDECPGLLITDFLVRAGAYTQ